jgi:hypothetical protein
MNSRDIAKDVAEGRVNGQVIIEVKDRILTVAAAGAGIGFGTLVLGGFPKGMLHITHAKASLKFTTADTDLIATFSGNFYIGTAADADGVASGTENNIIPSTAFGPAVARVTPAATGRLAAPFSAYLDNTASALRLNLNVNINAADIVDAQSAPLTVNGLVILMLGVQP